MIPDKTELIKRLVEIRGQGKLGELLERFAYAQRDLPAYDALVLTHAELDAGDIGRAAEKLLGVDGDEAAEIAMSLIVPNRKWDLGADLIVELAGELVPTPQAIEPQGSRPKKERKW